MLGEGLFFGGCVCFLFCLFRVVVVVVAFVVVFKVYLKQFLLEVAWLLASFRGEILFPNHCTNDERDRYPLLIFLLHKI